jgi:hypothetical protein
MRNQRRLLLPENLIIEIMGMVAQLGNVAADYHKKINSDDTENVTKVYQRIIERLMDLTEYDEAQPKSFEQMLYDSGVKLPEGDNNGNH